MCDADVSARAGWTVEDLAAACLAGGARFLQIRAKRATARWLLETARAVVTRASSAGALVLINDRSDIARMAGAGGVHVGQDDVTPAAARLVVGPDAVVGLSTHTRDQLAAGLTAPVNYLAIGPVFATTTKETGYAPLGLAGVAQAATYVAPHRLPLVAIGGVTLEQAPAVVRAGAAAVAVIGDIVATGDPTARVKAYLAALGA